MEFEKESANFVKINFKKSSSKDGGLGWDIQVQASDTTTQEIMNKVAEMALNTAFKCHTVISGRI